MPDIQFFEFSDDHLAELHFSTALYLMDCRVRFQFTDIDTYCTVWVFT